jgi:hypothetical protein
MAQSDSIAALAAALCEAQFAMEGAKKDSVNPHFKSKYADLTSVWDACRTPLHANGLAVVQAPEPCEIGIQLRTMLMHKSGEWIDSVLIIPAAQQSPQGYGSAMSYARRYALAAMLGVVSEDDDAEAATTPYRNAASNHQANGAGAAYSAPATNGSAPGKASDKQKKMLFAIWNKGGFEGKLTDWIAESFGCGIDDISIKQASEAIETLQPSEKASG